MKKLCSLFAAICVMASAVICAVPASAASTLGSGTPSDPYIITNAEQLKGMRDNLTACYKLGNTIDLANTDFKPIGRMNEPFKGTFICELNADGSPKFVIKNLKITVAETAYISERASKWEAALFGATDGATLSGIVVLDAYIKNDNFGDHTGAVQYGDYKPGMGDMPSGVLVGEAVNSVITNCGTSGTVDSRSNSTGGFIGMAQGSTIDNCWTTATVKSSSRYQKAAFCPNIRSTTITRCAAFGSITSENSSSAGGFLGDIARNSTITDCYSTGTVNMGRAFAFGGTATTSTFTNCYSMGSVGTPNTAAEKGVTASNCFVLAGKTHNQMSFTETSMDQIRQAFSGLSNWDVSGDHPVIKGMAIITDASKYVPLSESELSQTTKGSDTSKSGSGKSTTVKGGTASSGTLGNENSGDSIVVDTGELAELIKSLPNPDAEGELTVDCLSDAMKAVSEYESLSTSQREDFDPELSAKLLKVRHQLSILILSDFVTDVKKLPEPDKLTKKDYKKVKDLYAKYNFLDESVKSEIDEMYTKKLEGAYKAVLENENVSEKVTVVSDKLSAGQIVYVVICSVVVLLAITVSVVSCIFIARKPTEDKLEVE